VQAFEVVVHPRVLALLAGPGGARLEALEAVTRRRFFLVPAPADGHVHFDHFEVARQGKFETLRPPTPVAEGAEVEVKLVEVGLHDSTAGIGKLEAGYEIVVAGASKLVGKKVNVAVGRALAGGAYATLAAGAVATPAPITFEAEAEKPMRASRSKKDAAVVAESVPAAEPIEAVAEEEEEEEELPQPGQPAEESVEVVADGGPKKKRTRRGTRGGRGRKKPATAASEDGAEASADEAANGRPAAPRIHVPPADLEPAIASVSEPAVDAEPPGEETATETSEVAADGQPKKKRSRRGSRGGRKRRKPAAESVEESAVATETVAEAVVADGPPEYVPMSEWIEDFDAKERP
jgi:predicted RNA-binding protein with TRAM domain